MEDVGCFRCFSFQNGSNWTDYIFLTSLCRGDGWYFSMSNWINTEDQFYVAHSGDIIHNLWCWEEILFYFFNVCVYLYDYI